MNVVQVDNLAFIWISHKHADHMLGLAGILAARSATTPPLQVGPPVLLTNPSQSLESQVNCTMQTLYCNAFHRFVDLSVSTVNTYIDIAASILDIYTYCCVHLPRLFDTGEKTQQATPMYSNWATVMTYSQFISCQAVAVAHQHCILRFYCEDDSKLGNHNALFQPKWKVFVNGWCR